MFGLVVGSVLVFSLLVSQADSLSTMWMHRTAKYPQKWSRPRLVAHPNDPFRVCMSRNQYEEWILDEVDSNSRVSVSYVPLSSSEGGNSTTCYSVTIIEPGHYTLRAAKYGAIEGPREVNKPKMVCESLIRHTNRRSVWVTEEVPDRLLDYSQSIVYRSFPRINRTTTVYFHQPALNCEWEIIEQPSGISVEIERDVDDPNNGQKATGLNVMSTKAGVYRIRLRLKLHPSATQQLILDEIDYSIRLQFVPDYTLTDDE